MKINIRGEKIKVTPSIKNYVEEKLSRLNRYFENPDSITAHVLIKVRGNDETVEITIPTTYYTLRREETNDDLYAAIDFVLDKLERQIRKNKTRFEKKNKEVPNFDLLLDFEPIKETTNKIVKRKDLEVKPMSEEEAILQQELLNHDFFVFKNSDTDNYSVLYSRKDGNYGIINIK